MSGDKIDVLLVEDSPVVRMLLAHLLNGDPRIRVMGTVNNGQEAVDYVAAHKPDVILMDVHMPTMDGYEATRRIMETNPVPIVTSSASMKTDEVDTTFRALEAGAVAFVEKPVGPGSPEFDVMARNLLDTVKLMAGVKVVKRWSRNRFGARPASPLPDVARRREGVQVIAIGASTGGPPAIQTILRGLPERFATPILIVQHIASGFLPGMVEWLAQTSRLPVQLGAQGVPVLPGHVYLAPDGAHMGVLPGGRILLSMEEPENGLRPAVSFLFRSVTGVYGSRAAGVLLSGMGRDGVDELKLLRERGGVTIAQDRESSVVHGMPGEAIQQGAALYVLPPERIASALLQMVSP
jgi:two-component system chemotaxis response regulator CheB